MIPSAVPIIAVCDANGNSNWVSSKLVEELQVSCRTSFEITHLPTGRSRAAGARITIRWSCGRLDRDSEETTFYIEPKAHFKMMFGCASPRPSPPAKQRTLFGGQHSRLRIRRKEKMIPLSDDTSRRFYKGIEDGSLLRLRRLPPLYSARNSLMSVADLETELKYVHDSYTYTDKVLSSESSYDNTSQPNHDDLLSTLEISCPSETDTEVESQPRTESTNTSVSENASYQFSSISDKLPRDQSPYVIDSWATQHIDDGPWTSRTVQIRPEPASYHFRRCYDLNSRQETMLQAAKAAAEKESAAYWEWDAKEKKYKHYGEGCTEPVWYNPP